MSLGYAVKIMECIVTVYCGAILAVRPCELRWDHKAAKVAVGILVTLVAAMNILNIPWAKFAGTIYSLTGACLFVIFFIFFQIDFWQLFVQNFIYWYTVKLVIYFLVYICCMVEQQIFTEYIRQNYGLPWSNLHVFSMLLVSGIILLVCCVMRGRALIVCRKKKTYFYLSVFVLVEKLIDEYVFTASDAVSLIQKSKVVLIALIFMLLVSVVVILGIAKSYMEIRHQEQMTRMNLSLTRKQYDLMQDLYTRKRRQIHDEVQHDIIVRGYLQNNQTDKALAYLDRKLAVQGEQHKNKYTGVTVIDLILDYKISMAKEKGIEAEVNTDVLGCGMEDSDLGIVLGNLLDNAIEAVSELPEGTRKFYVGIKTKDEMLVIVTRNGYTGQRKKCDGRYETTKTDKAMHGLGLESVRLIVDKYTGCMEINDDGRNFEVMVVIYKFMD